MELLKSKKLKLPILYFITDREEIKDIPIGVPFIYGSSEIKEHLIRLLEYEVLYEAAKKSGYPFNFKKILRENGYNDLEDFWYNPNTELEMGEGGHITAYFFSDEGKDLFNKFIKDSTAYVDMEVLKNLKVFPTWLTDIEEAVRTNIHNFAVYNPYLYNKKLDGMYGGIEMTSPRKNLIIIDISGSIPKAVSSTILTLAKNLSEEFYADLLITGSKSTLYEYEEIEKLDVTKVYEENGMDNDQVYFKRLVTELERKYETAIVFGDGHHPGAVWYNKYNVDATYITQEEGQKLNKWQVNKVISLHTTSNTDIAGYAKWFKPKETKHIKNWVKYLENNN